MIWYKVALYDPRAYVVGVVFQKPCTAYIGVPHSVSSVGHRSEVTTDQGGHGRGRRAGAGPRRSPLGLHLFFGIAQR